MVKDAPLEQLTADDARGRHRQAGRLRENLPQRRELPAAYPRADPRARADF